MRPSVQVHHSIDRLIFKKEGDHVRTLNRLKRKRRGECPSWADRQAPSCRIVLRIHTLPTLQTVRRVGRFMSQSLSEIRRVLVVPEAVQVRRICFCGLNSKRQDYDSREHKIDQPLQQLEAQLELLKCGSDMSSGRTEAQATSCGEICDSFPPTRRT